MMPGASAIPATAAAAPAGQGQPHLTLRKVSKTYRNGAHVLRGIDLKIEEGSFVSVIGPSGCGKSTLLKLVSGLSAISSGEIIIEGMTPANARATMSFIFQDATLLPWRNVRRNVGLGLELEGISAPRRDQKVNDLLATVGLEGVADRYPRQLSGGMKMRVSIARALATTPRLLLMDEPFGALDEITRDRLNEELLRLRERDGWTAMFVTHSVAEAVFLSTRILVLAANPGQVAHDIPVAFPYPRDDTLRASDSYQRAVLEVSRALRDLPKS